MVQTLSYLRQDKIGVGEFSRVVGNGSGHLDRCRWSLKCLEWRLGHSSSSWFRIDTDVLPFYGRITPAERSGELT
jgi:hypothetical protein